MQLNLQNQKSKTYHYCCFKLQTFFATKMWGQTQSRSQSGFKTFHLVKKPTLMLVKMPTLNTIKLILKKTIKIKKKKQSFWADALEVAYFRCVKSTPSQPNYNSKLITYVARDRNNQSDVFRSSAENCFAEDSKNKLNDYRYPEEQRALIYDGRKRKWYKKDR